MSDDISILAEPVARAAQFTNMLWKTARWQDAQRWTSNQSSILLLIWVLGCTLSPNSMYLFLACILPLQPTCMHPGKSRSIEYRWSATITDDTNGNRYQFVKQWLHGGARTPCGLNERALCGLAPFLPWEPHAASGRRSRGPVAMWADAQFVPCTTPVLLEMVVCNYY